MPDRSGRGAGKIILGTMRLHEIDRDVEAWADFFLAAHKLGVDTLHSSTEYESFPLLLRILARVADIAPYTRFRHMVKLGEPHFDENDFDAERLSGRIDEYRKALNADCIADVQWMWRNGLKDDASRVAQFRAAARQIAAAFATLKSGGAVERFMCFPYTPAFADAALDMDGMDGLVVYRNIEEVEYEAALDRAGAQGKPCIVIRPFLGGRLVKDGASDPVAMVRFALDKPAIEAAVVSSSSLGRLGQLTGGLQ